MVVKKNDTPGEGSFRHERQDSYDKAKGTTRYNRAS